MVRRLPAQHRNAPIGRVKENDAFFRLSLLLVVGLVLACGFVYAGRQHFAALKYGYETEKLRSHRNKLAEEQRRLFLEREEVANPVRLEEAARRLGMRPLQPAQIDPLRQGLNNRPKTETLAGRPTQKPAKREAVKEAKVAAKRPAKSLRKPS